MGAEVGLARPCALNRLVFRVIGGRCRIERQLLRLLLRRSIWASLFGSDRLTELVLPIGLTELVLPNRLATLFWRSELTGCCRLCGRSELPRLSWLVWLSVLSLLVVLSWLAELVHSTWLACASLLTWAAELALSAELTRSTLLTWM